MEALFERAVKDKEFWNTHVIEEVTLSKTGLKKKSDVVQSEYGNVIREPPPLGGKGADRAQASQIEEVQTDLTGAWLRSSRARQRQNQKRRRQEAAQLAAQRAPSQADPQAGARPPAAHLVPGPLAGLGAPALGTAAGAVGGPPLGKGGGKGKKGGKAQGKGQKGKGQCWFWAATGQCNRGTNCPFAHQ